MAEKKKKKTPGGFTTKTEYTPGLRKKGESFMDFTTRQHEQRYPGAQRMAMEAGAGGWRAFTPAGAEYRRGIREEMPWLKQGQRYQSEDWKRMLANRQGGMYGGDKGTAAQVGGAPPGRPPLPTSMGNVLGGAPRPIPSGVPLPPGGYQGDPRGRIPQRRAVRGLSPSGAYQGDPRLRQPQISPQGYGMQHDFPPVVPPVRRPPPGGQLPPSIQHFPNRNIRQAMPLTTPSVGTGVTDMPPRWPKAPTQVQVPMGSGRFVPTQQGAHRRLPFNPMTGQMGNFGQNNVLYPGMQRNVGGVSSGRALAQQGYMEQPGRRGTAQRMWAERGYPWTPSYRELLGY
jgi:hypothetical protein